MKAKAIASSRFKVELPFGPVGGVLTVECAGPAKGSTISALIRHIAPKLCGTVKADAGRAIVENRSFGRNQLAGLAEKALIGMDERHIRRDIDGLGQSHDALLNVVVKVNARRSSPKIV